MECRYTFGSCRALDRIWILIVFPLYLFKLNKTDNICFSRGKLENQEKKPSLGPSLALRSCIFIKLAKQFFRSLPFSVLCHSLWIFSYGVSCVLCCRIESIYQVEAKKKKRTSNLAVQFLLTELESVGNTRFEEGSPNDVWYSCFAVF